MSQDVLITVMNSMSLNNDSVNVKMQKCELCEKCLNLDAELSKSKQAYNDLLKNHSQLEKHSRIQDKDPTISKLKDTIKSLKMNTKEKNVNHDKCDLEPINEELENSVAKLLSENERLCNEINHVKQVFVITSLKNDLRKSKGKEIVENVVHIPSATTIAPGMFKLDLEPLPPRLLQNREVHIAYLRNTQEQANILREIIEQAKAKQPLDSELVLTCKYATRIQELLVYVQDTCPNAITPSTKKVVVTPMNNVKKVRNEVGQIVLWYLDSECSKHMTGNRSQLMNFVSKFLGTVRFGNDQIARIMGYGDYQLGNVIISRVYYVEGLANIFGFVGYFCDLAFEVAFQINIDLFANLEGVDLISGFLKTKDEAPAAIIKCIKNIQVRLKATIRNVRTDNGTEFVNQTLREWYENVGITHQTSVARTPQQNGLSIQLLYKNRSLIRLRYNKTLYELMQDKKPDLSFFHVFGSLCYHTNDHEDLGKFDAKADIGIFVGYAPAKKAFRIYNRRTRIINETIHVTFDELIAMASEQFSSGPGLHYMTPATSSTRLGLNPVSQQPCIPPNIDDWDHLFQPMFEEYFNPPPIAISLVQEAVALRAEVLADSPVLTSIDQDAPSTSIPSSKEHEQSPIIFQSYEESPKTPTFHDDPLDESPNEDSTPQGSSSNMRLLEYEHVVYESDFARMRLQHRRLYLHLNVQFRRTSLTRFPNQSVRPFNAYALGSPYLLVLNTGTSQSRQHVITSLIHIESSKSPTKSLFDVGSSRISIFTVNT
ncbi:integrase, catalytic region, zinc finger, CCHC-type containing protein [Tanacetum coccineum]|uniref:Integrase, catalytic region, zinc finger, CCHC-type containing protein n=1 Tax=Tanacetum coccineum TaxID=301880 RepID=A0ABQ5ATU1_9ASTR